MLCVATINDGTNVGAIKRELESYLMTEKNVIAISRHGLALTVELAMHQRKRLPTPFNKFTIVLLIIVMVHTAMASDNALMSGEHVPALTGVEQLTCIERLPFLRLDTQVHYEGSIDKRGVNADWDWWLYQDTKTQEWVIFEADGPGCLWNFVVHHSVAHSDPVYRFYFDGNKSPAFEIKHSEFGSKAPFVTPLADKFLPQVSKDPLLKEISFQIVRSFCPMPFFKSLRITSSIKLQGNQTTGGGWGHAIWHSYANAEGVKSFTAEKNVEALLALWRRPGEDPKPRSGNQTKAFKHLLSAQETSTIFEYSGEGSIAAIRMRLEPANRATMQKLWVRITWDEESRPAIECPMGAFFGNEFGFNKLQTLLQGTGEDGSMYNYWPMPFWQSAKVELVNRGEESISVEGKVDYKSAEVLAYPHDRTGHFRSSTYQSMPKQPGRDSLVASFSGSGHVVAAVITSEGSMCEGDVRVHIDGCATPTVESDGSESWACYGWGFEFPPQANPASSYDGTGNPSWSMLRLLMGDFYPFRTSFRMTVEGGWGNKSGSELRSGLVFWYGEHEPVMAQTDFVDVGNSDSETEHDYKAPDSSLWDLTSSFEGEFDDVLITDNGRTLSGASQFIVKIEPNNNGIILRRRADQKNRNQRANVYVDGQQVSERSWMCPDGNPHFRWIEDEFFIPVSYTKGKRKISIRINPIDDGNGTNWNESLYWVFSLER
jgi:hypothetical protein